MHTHLQIFGGLDQNDTMLSDLWCINTSLFSQTNIPAWVLLTPSSGLPARHSFGMVAIGQRLVVMGGRVQTDGAGSLLSNDLWAINAKADSTAQWTSVIQEGVPYALTARSNFAMVSVGLTIIVIGGKGNFDTFADVQHMDLCKTPQCSSGTKWSCDWNVTNSERCECLACVSGENCCRATTYEARDSICKGMSMRLSSCTLTDLQWDTLVQATGFSVFMPVSNCTQWVRSMCESLNLPGMETFLTSKEDPLLCRQSFMCASDSPFNSIRFAQTSACGVQGAKCTPQNRPNRVCCSYIEHLIENSCEKLRPDFVSYLARSRFPTCRDTNCFSPATFQVTPAPLGSPQVQSLLSVNNQVPASQAPDARAGAAAVVIGQSVFMYGGQTLLGKYSMELWELDATSYPPTWYNFSMVRAGPSTGRRYAAVAALEPSGRMLVHGGEGPQFLLDDLFVLDTRKPSLDMPYKWLDLTTSVLGDVPGERCLHAMIGMSASEAYMFGGKTLQGVTDEVTAHVCVYVYSCVHVK
jgi:hypothetical protein